MSESQYKDLKDKRRVDARYVDQPIKENDTNKLIAALPRIRTKMECISDFLNYPAIPNIDQLSDEEKAIVMQNTLNKLRFGNFYLPQLELQIAFLMRESYQNKKMYDISRLRNYYYDDLRQDTEYIYLSDKKEEMNGITVCGISGGGKTTAINEVINHIPQVIRHDGGNFMQLTYIKVNCPANSSIGSFYDNCIQEIEKAIERKLITSKTVFKNVKEKEVFFKIQANRFVLGILVIDEIQNLELEKTMSLKQLLELSNEINCPIVLVGTYKAIKIIENKNFCVTRRSGMRIRVDPFRNDDKWENIIKTLWKYQWSDQPSALTNEIKESLYEHTGGIFACLLNLYKAITMDSVLNGIKEITPDYILKIVKKYFPYMENLAFKLATPEGQNGWDDMYRCKLKEVETVDNNVLKTLMENSNRDNRSQVNDIDEIGIKSMVINNVVTVANDICDFTKAEELYRVFYNENYENFKDINVNKRSQVLVKYLYNNSNITDHKAIKEKQKVKKDLKPISLPRLNKENVL